MLQKIWAWCRQSATLVVARGQVIAGALIGVLNEVAMIIGGSNAAQFLPPRWLSLYLFASGVITELARRRTLEK
jgi:hypothetical protein